MTLFVLMLALPLIATAAIAFTKRPKTALLIAAGSALCTSTAGVAAIWSVYLHGPLRVAGGWIALDQLSAFHLAILLAVYTLSSLYAPGYFAADITQGHLTLRKARQYSMLWCAALVSMELVLLSQNVGLMWVGVESTTLLTAFLVSLHSTRSSLEAMWKYLLMCSIGMGIAFMGILLIAATAQNTGGADTSRMLLWLDLRANAALLDPVLAKMGFVFIAVGFGTKAGLAPMHNWLPDAHSQAPAPVSAFFSGFMINAPLYCIMRYMPIVDSAAGPGWSGQILKVLGLVSILVAAAFIVFQRDIKRLLAYCSVEHMGIICLGLSAGGFGVFAALFHMAGHSLSKTVAFLAAGKLGHAYGTNDMQRMSGAWRVSRSWGIALFLSLLALIGAAPFSLFLSEFQIVTTLIESKSGWTAGLFLLGAAAVFVAMLNNAISICSGPAPENVGTIRSRSIDWLLVVLPLAALLALGLWMPPGLQRFIAQAGALVDPAFIPPAGVAAAGAILP